MEKYSSKTIDSLQKIVDIVGKALSTENVARLFYNVVSAGMPVEKISGRIIELLKKKHEDIEAYVYTKKAVDAVTDKESRKVYGITGRSTVWRVDRLDDRSVVLSVMTPETSDRKKFHEKCTSDEIVLQIMKYDIENSTQ